MIPQACLILSGAEVKGVILECQRDNKILMSIISKILSPTCYFNEVKRCVRERCDVMYQKMLMMITVAVMLVMGLLRRG